jgi:hypothetical protein
MSRGRKERTPAQLAVLAQAREKAKIVIAERAKLNALQKTVPSHEPVSEEESPPEPEPESENPPELVSAPVPPPKEDSDSENEDEEPRLTRREVGEMIQRTLSKRPSPKYHYINGMYIKIK